MNSINLAIVGATGLVGTTFIKVLEEKTYIKIDNIYFYASSKSAGKTICFRNRQYSVLLLNKENIIDKKIDYALFSAGANISKIYASIFKDIGAVVIDNSSCFRMEEGVPLVVPQVNKSACLKHNGIIANPNCSTIGVIAPLKVLQDNYGIKNISYVTFQAVSGSGMKGLIDLENTTNGAKPSFYPYPIYNNCLPHIDNFLENGYTKEEMKMINETKKILDDKSLNITATCVRVPIQNSHSINVNVELKKDFDLTEVRKQFEKFESIKLIDDIDNLKYPYATMATGSDYIYVGRIRRDLSRPNSITFFCVSDNIRKGAASNAIEIMELLIKNRS